MRGAVLLACLGLLSACAAQRQAAPAAGDRPSIAGMPGGIRYGATDPGESGARAAGFWQQLARRSAAQPVNLLAISGGGADCAFSAGALMGLGQRDAPPVYDVVTGVSCGALLAPFALLGPGWDASLQQLFDPHNGRGLMHFSPSVTGLYSPRPLKALIARTYTDAVIRAVAGEAARGRTLLVGTTNLDDQSPVIWDLTAIAALDTPASRTLFRQVLLATSSYPGLLPSVLIDVATSRGARQEMHVDGGMALPMFLGPLTEQLEPQAIGALPHLHAYALINRRLEAVPASVPNGAIPVLRRALSMDSRLATRATLLAAAEFAQQHGFDLQVAGIEQAGKIPAPFSFRDPGLVPLFETGQRRAASGSLWSSPAQAMNPAPRAPVAGAGN